MAAPALTLANASAACGARIALAGIDLTLRVGERVALMGRLGAGKSTLLGLIAANAGMTMAVNALSRALRRSLRIADLPTRLSRPLGPTAGV